MIYAAAITGPTAGGKTALSLQICKDFEAEIISCDSMQIYQGMDIGTAKATAAERAAAPHHMIDILSPDESFSAADYKQMALPIAADIEARGRLPLFVGGTGLYLDTVKRSFVGQAPESSPEYRECVLAGVKNEEDRIALWKRLEKIDPRSAEQIHYNNIKRVVRALEIYDTTGKTKSYFDEISSSPSDEISIVHITLDFHSRDLLYERIDRRVDEMMANGLFKEVEELIEHGYLKDDTTASGAIGYKEVIAGISAGMSRSEIGESIKKASRNYAKRQLTWFRHSDGAITVYLDDDAGVLRQFSEVYSEIVGILKNKTTLKPKGSADT